MKLRTALYDGHTELATIDDLVGITLGTPVFPTGNAGEVVFVDGSNHAATSADLTFDDATDTLKLGTAGGAAIWFRDSTIDPANPRLIMEQPVGQYLLRLRGQDNDGVGNAILEGIGTWVDATDYNGYRLDNSGDENRLLSYATGMQAEQGWRIGTFLNYIQIMTSAFAPRTVDTIGISVGNVPNFYSFTPQTFFPDGEGDNAVDLGSSGDATYGTVRWRTGYFGTSVVTPLLTADAVTFPDADPHVAGAGYWVTGVLTKSAG